MNHFIQVLLAIITVSVVGLTRINQQPVLEQPIEAEIIDIALDTGTIIVDIKNLPKTFSIVVINTTEIITVTDRPLELQDLAIGDELIIMLQQSETNLVFESIERI